MISKLSAWGTLVVFALALALVVSLFNDLLTTLLLLMGG